MLDKYKLVNGGTRQVTIREKTGVDFLQKMKEEKCNTETKKESHINKVTNTTVSIAYKNGIRGNIGQ